MTKETNTQINVGISASKGIFHENDNTHLNVHTTLQKSSSTANLASRDASCEENAHPNAYPILRRSSTTSNLTPNDSNTFLSLPGEPSHLSKSGSCISFKRLSTVALNLFSLQKRLGELKNKATADKTLLHYAAESGNGKLLEEAINTLCNSGCNIKEEVNGKDKSGKTPLHYAAKSGNEECFRLLRREGARFADTINFKSELHYAARSGNIELLTHLQKTEKFKEALSKEDKYGNNALHYAAQSGDKKIIQFFIEHCVQFISNQYNENPLHKIASIIRPLAETGLCKRSINASEDAIDLLIENLTTSGRLKDEIMHKDENGDTPLHIAARHGNITAIEAFKKAGADINSKNNKGNTPLHMAIIHGHSDCINLFFENNQSEVKGQHSRDPIHLAAMYGRANSLKKLFKKCADYDVGKEVDDQGNTALHLAMSDDTKSAMLNHTEIANRKKIIELLINKGAEKTQENNNGDTFLHLVARYGNKELFTFAIDKHYINLDEEIRRKNNIGDTIFHMAARAGDKELLEYLFDHKKLSTKEKRSNENRNKTLLHLAAKSGNTECVEFIIKKIKENNNEFELSTMSGSDQRNLLFLAAVSGNEECFEFFFDHFEALENYSVLLDHGINNNTILHKAALSGNLDCFQYICNKIVSTMQENGFAYSIDDLFVQNNNGLTPLHLATMYFNADIIEHITASKKGESNNYFFYTSLKKLLNSQSKSGSTPLHYLVMNDNDFDIIHDEVLKSTMLYCSKPNKMEKKLSMRE